MELKPDKPLRVCVVTPSNPGLTETFIRAHTEKLPHDVVHVHGPSLDYTWNSRKLREWYADCHRQRGRWLNLLPRLVEFRLRPKFYPLESDSEIATSFLKSQNIEVVLAEYGTAAAFITPVCQAAGIPLVAHFHGYDASSFRTLEDFAESYRLMFDYAASVISVSNDMSRRLSELGCPIEKICYNPYGPDSRFFDVQPDYSSQTLIAVGRHTGQKAPYLTLDAFRRAKKNCPELHLCMIGDGELFEVSHKLVTAWDLEDSVELLGAQNPDVIRDKMSSAFAFVQHSIQALNGNAEGMPVAVLEAAAAGLPVISTRHAGIPESVIDQQTGFIVEAGDTAQMSDRILQLANDRGLAERMGKAGNQLIEEAFSMDRHIQKLSQALIDATDKLSERIS